MHWLLHYQIQIVMALVVVAFQNSMTLGHIYKFYIRQYGTNFDRKVAIRTR